MLAEVKILKMLNVEVGLKPSVEICAELDLTLSRLVSGKSELGRNWVRRAPHYLQKNALAGCAAFFIPGPPPVVGAAFLVLVPDPGR